MTREEYVTITEPYRKNPKKKQWISRANLLATLAVFVTYPVILIGLLVKKDPLLLQTILIPLDGYILVTVFRYMINRPRPYETFGLPPVIPKETKGKSFPSRHVYSAAVIAATLCLIPGLRPVGIFLLLLAAGLGWIRVLTGVHYPSDVAAGYLAGLFTAGIGQCIALFLR